MMGPQHMPDLTPGGGIGGLMDYYLRMREARSGQRPGGGPQGLAMLYAQQAGPAPPPFAGKGQMYDAEVPGSRGPARPFGSGWPGVYASEYAAKNYAGTVSPTARSYEGFAPTRGRMR